MALCCIWCNIILQYVVANNKTEYLQLLAKLDRLNISNYYTTAVEVSVLGHYLHDSVKVIKDVECFITQDFPKANVRSLLDEIYSQNIDLCISENLLW